MSKNKRKSEQRMIIALILLLGFSVLTFFTQIVIVLFFAQTALADAELHQIVVFSILLWIAVGIVLNIAMRGFLGPMFKKHKKK